MTPEQQRDTERRNLRRAAAWAGYALARFAPRWRAARAFVHVPPRHAMTQHVAAFRGIDRTTLAGSSWRTPQPPLTFEAFQEAARAALAYRPPPPVIKPWITHANAAQLVLRGISIERIAELFTIIG